MLTPLFRSAVAWTAVGLVGGLAYREITKLAGFTGFTQLGLVHTHSLALGTTVFLAVLALGAALRLQKHRLMRWFLIVWNAGLALTVAMLAVKGTLQVRGDALADSAAIAGVAGLGHMTLAAGFVLLLLLVRAGLRDREALEPALPQGSPR